MSSTTDIADIVKIIGGDHVAVTSIARGNQDPHYVEILPSYMLKVRKADIYFMVGMELDLWAQQIIDGSRNRKLVVSPGGRFRPDLHQRILRRPQTARIPVYPRPLERLEGTAPG